MKAVYPAVDYQTIGFEPYLQIRITTPEQLAAYETILRFRDHVDLGLYYDSDYNLIMEKNT